jgi:hypothetical protein
MTDLASAMRSLDALTATVPTGPFDVNAAFVGLVQAIPPLAHTAVADAIDQAIASTILTFAWMVLDSLLLSVGRYANLRVQKEAVFFHIRDVDVYELLTMARRCQVLTRPSTRQTSARGSHSRWTDGQCEQELHALFGRSPDIYSTL